MPGSWKGIINASKSWIKGGQAAQVDDEEMSLQQYLDAEGRPRHAVVLCLGSPGVGKQSLRKRMVTHSYVTGYDPTDSHDTIKQVKLLDGAVFLEFVTCEEIVPCGRDLTRDAMESVLDRGDLVMFTYNVADRASFEDMQRVYEMSSNVGQSSDRTRAWHGGIVVALACDLAGQPGSVSSSEGDAFAKSKGLTFFETSAKTGLGCTNDDLAKMAECLLTMKLRQMPRAHR